MSLVVALASVPGFAIIDHLLLVGPRFAKPDLWRFGLRLPRVLLLLVFTTPSLYQRWPARRADRPAPVWHWHRAHGGEATPAQR